VAPGFVMVQKSVIGAGAKRKNHDDLSRFIGKLIDYTVRVSTSVLFKIVVQDFSGEQIFSLFLAPAESYLMTTGLIYYFLESSRCQDITY